MNHIELFAGCGGLSLGLETAGFKLLLANELSPMASETFAYNHLNADLMSQKNINKVYWVSSEYSRENIQARLRENPFTASGLAPNKYSDLADLNSVTKNLKRSLLIGSIVDINQLMQQKGNKLLKNLQTGLGEGGVDLVSGGPPCQSFSLAGLRDYTHHRNQLPLEFSKFVGMVKPKVALLENVSGILRPFNIDGSKFYAWFEVAKVFAREGYIPLCLHINAKYVGTAQNRPRFIMISMREDVYDLIQNNSKDETLLKLLKPSFDFFSRIKKGGKPKYGDLPYYDIEKERTLFKDSILSPLISNEDKVVSAKEAIDDLRSKNISESGYVKHINTCFYTKYKLPLNKYENHVYRQNNNKVRARFRVYQIINKLSKSDSKLISNYLKSSGETVIPTLVLNELKKYWILDTYGTKISKPTTKQIITLLKELYTKKQTQRSLIASEPAPATLSIPDDACHYHESVATQRTLTVREMARIQSFPDWYQIKSKVTTGGQMRKFEVPQYTQIGNAVPPLLGIALGEVCKKLINISKA